MPAQSAPSLTLAVEVPDYHSLAKRFEHSAVRQLTCLEADALARRRIDVPADAAPHAIEVAVMLALASVLPSRLLTAKAITGTLGEVYVYDPLNRQYILVGQFSTVDTEAVEVAA